MNQKPSEKNSLVYLVAVATTGISLWLAAALSLRFNYILRDCLIFLALVPAIIVTGMFTNTLPMPSALRFSREKMNFTLSDAIVLLVACWYGAMPAIFIAGIEGFVSSRRGVRRLSSNLFSFGMLSLVAGLSALILGAVLRFGFGEPAAGHQHSIPAVAVAFLAASVVHIISNTGLISTLFAMRLDKPVAPLWKENFLLAAPLFLPTSAAASLMYMALQYNALTMIAIGAPILIAIHFGHRRYRDSVREQINLIEQAQRERAEQAERHVEELNGYVGELEQKSKELHHAAFHDALTGLPNRALLIEKLGLAIERAERRNGFQFAVLFLDLDRFKNVNDSLGHTIGDELLTTIARRLENSVREVDTVARLGGDEFAILLEGIKTSEDAVYMAERVQKELTTPFILSSHEVFTATSIGIALSTAGYEHPEDILRDADTAMYRAKEGGRARHEVFSQEMHARAVNLLTLETDLRRAIEREEFLVYYQPIVALSTGRIAGFEALVRWQHPERGLIPPAEFISVAEDTRVIIPLGLWVLREACRQMCRWQWQSPDNRSLTLSVNLSGVQFTQPDLVEQIKRILDETNLDPHSLKLEITESVVMEHAEAAIAMLVQLKALGVQLSIDDFGTGYSSLSYLHRFPTDALKIDRSFVCQMGMSDENAEIVRTIKTLAGNLGMEVVAEGVETLEQLARLGALGCEYAQGYLFSKPVHAEATEALIARNPLWQINGFRQTGESFVPVRSCPEAVHLRTA
ncbi:MAG TPA: EAL domain-containing protein [Pyrinomonadaceae bacterium]|jgi:diguanylate cyclase (GGDEF)-like protein